MGPVTRWPQAHAPRLVDTESALPTVAPRHYHPAATAIPYESSGERGNRIMILPATPRVTPSSPPLPGFALIGTALWAQDARPRHSAAAAGISPPPPRRPPPAKGRHAVRPRIQKVAPGIRKAWPRTATRCSSTTPAGLTTARSSTLDAPTPRRPERQPSRSARVMSQGRDEGIAGMKIGEKRTLTVPVGNRWDGKRGMGA